MPEQNAARLYKTVQRAHAEQERQSALNDPEKFIRLAAARGMPLTIENFSAQISQLSDEEIAAIFNPGIPPRRHLFPR